MSRLAQQHEARIPDAVEQPVAVAARAREWFSRAAELARSARDGGRAVATCTGRALLGLCLSLGSCGAPPRASQTAEDRVEASQPASSSELRPVAATGETAATMHPAVAPSGGVRALDVEGFLPAVLFVPAGKDPARLIVATHGAGGAPEWECDYWRQLTRDSAFVLSLRGKSMGEGSYYYPNHHELEAELNAAVRAARAAEPRILAGAGIYSGYSQGASMGSAMLSRHGASFPYLVLIEGFELWNIPRARRFAQSGGKRVLFACGTVQCNRVAEESSRWLVQGGIDARVEYVDGGGHTPAGEVMQRVEAALPWLLRD